MAGLEPRPLGNGPPGRPFGYRRPAGCAGRTPSVGAILRPAGRRVLPRLLASVRAEVHEREAFAGVGLLPDPQLIEFGPEDGLVDDRRQARCTGHAGRAAAACGSFVM